MNLSQLYDVNTKINDGNKYATDLEQYGKLDFFEDIRKSRIGDCDDYAIAKFLELLELGWSIENLRLAKCFTEPFPVVDPDGSVRDATWQERYHMVLLAKIDSIDYCLCNRMTIPKPASQTGYIFDQVQEAGTPFFRKVAGSPNVFAKEEE